MSIKMIDYNIIRPLRLTQILSYYLIMFVSKLFYTISFINYCNCYKLYTQCWPYQIFVHGAFHGVNLNYLV